MAQTNDERTLCVSIKRMVQDSGDLYWTEYFVPRDLMPELLPQSFLEEFTSYGDVDDEPAVVTKTLDALDKDPRVVRVNFFDGAEMKRGDQVLSPPADGKLERLVPFPPGVLVCDQYVAVLLRA